MSTGENNLKNEPDEAFMQRLQMATQIHFLKKRIEQLENEQNSTQSLLIKMWNTAIGWVIPRYTDYPRK